MILQPKALGQLPFVGRNVDLHDPKDCAGDHWTVMAVLGWSGRGPDVSLEGRVKLDT